MAAELTQILLNAQSADAAVRKAAEDQLRQAQEQNYSMFLVALAAELATESKPAESRRLAGLILKNALHAKEEARRKEYQKLWTDMDKGAKDQVKQALLAALGSPERSAGAPAAQVVAKVAAIEVPQGAWPELVQVLLGNMTAAAPPVEGGDLNNLRQSTLETLGYLCEELIGTDALVQDSVNSILTAIVQGMHKSQASAAVRLAATTALDNALEFAEANFKNENERNYIMQVVCETTAAEDARLRTAAFQCLVSIADAYYEHLPQYMTNIFNLTVKAIREDEEEVAVIAVELWSTVAEEEMDIQEQLEDGDVDSGGAPPVAYHKFMEQATPSLVPVLLETLTKQVEGQEEDNEWNLSMAGGTCLGLVAQTVRDPVVDVVMPYVTERIQMPDWRQREAATMAFGSILDGPSVEKLKPLVDQAMTFMLAAMKDQHTMVKDTTAWTIGRMCEFLHGFNPPVFNEQTLRAILEVLLQAIGDVPSVAEKVCWAIHNLAAGFEDLPAGERSPMSPFFQGVVQALLVAAARTDAGDSRLRSSAYETLNQVIRSSTDDTVPMLQQLLPAIMQKASETVHMPVVSSDDREAQNELQGLLCGTLQTIIQKCGSQPEAKAAVQANADNLFTLFLGVFSCRSATVHEEAMLAMGALADAVGEGFEKYMQAFYPYLEMGLKNVEEYQVCAVTVGVVGDVCRALEARMVPYCDGVVYQLIQDLQSNELHRSVKPPILSCFGDIALAVGDKFEKFVQFVFPMIQTAAQISAQQLVNDPDMAEYNASLRSGIFEAYSAILQGSRPEAPPPQQQLTPYMQSLLQYAEPIVAFVEVVANDADNSDESVNMAAIGVLGDLADMFGPHCAAAYRARPFWQQFIQRAAHEAGDEQSAEVARWATGRIQAAMQMAGGAAMG